MVQFSGPLLLGGLLVLTSVASAQPVSFGALTTYSLGGSSPTQTLLLADLNTDSKPDLVAANGNTINVLLGTGAGTFGASTAYSPDRSTPSLSSLALADINSDGNLDAVTVGLTSTVRTALGNGTGGFTSAALYMISGGILATVAAADLNADGKPDLVATDDINHQLYVLLNTGGAFGAPTSYSYSSSGLSQIRVVDVNADNRPDILVSGTGNSLLSVLLNAGAGVFVAGVTYSTGGVGAYGIGVADFNGDARPDVAVSNNFAYGAGVLLASGSGIFGPATVYQTSGASQSSARPNDLKAADMNGDGKPDLVAVHGTSSNAGTIGVVPGTGNGTFGSAMDISYGTGVQPVASKLVTQDINNDGKLDIVVAFASGTIGVLLNTTPLPTRATLPGASVSLAPNPAGPATTLHVAGLTAAVARVQAAVLDATGREVSRHALPVRQGTAQAELPTTGLAPSLYVVRLTAIDEQGAPAGELPAQRLSVQ